MTFQTQLGTYADKTERIKTIACIIGERIGAVDVGRAATLGQSGSHDRHGR